MKRKLREWIKRHFGLYDISDLRVGGNCGCCGDWMPVAIVEKEWRWSLCEKCIWAGMTEAEQIEEAKRRG